MRRRTLSDDELRGVWRACDEIGFPYGPLVKLLMLTGARRAEVSDLPWSELNLDRAEWVLPAARAKNAVEHLVPLSAQAMAVIDALPRIDNEADLLFPGPVSGKRLGSSSFTWVKSRLDEATGIRDWVFHDLRRTVATGMQRLGVRLEVTEAVLNHVGGTRKGIIGVYQTYSYADEKRAALEAWGRHIDYVLTGEPAKVVNLPKRGA